MVTFFYSGSIAVIGAGTLQLETTQTARPIIVVEH